MSDTNEHSLSLSYQIRRAIKAEDALHVAKQEIANLNELLNAAYVDKTAQQAQPERAPLSCTWTQEDDFDMPGVYHTSCGEMWSFTEGGIKENKPSSAHTAVAASSKEASSDHSHSNKSSDGAHTSRSS